MGSAQDSLNNEVLLNPRLPTVDAESLIEAARKVSKDFGLENHIWLSTSGSTSESAGQNKLVALSVEAFEASAKSVNAHLQITPADTWLQVLPRFHVGGLGIEFRAKLSGSKVVSDFAKWDPARACALLKDQSITIASMVPTQVFDLVRANLRAPKNLRAVIVGGGAMTESLYVKARSLGWPLLPSYGMTETCSQIATASLESLASSGSMPLPQKLGHVDWRKNSGDLLEVRGLSLLTCYAQRQADGSIRGWDPKVNGWFTSEDRVELLDNYVRVTGRVNDFIKIGGEASSIGRLRGVWEQVLEQELPAVASREFVLVDSPSERLGAEIHLVTTSPTESELVTRLRDNFNREVLPFERIREVKYISQIPRSDLGKVLWAKLKRDLYGS